MKKSIICFAIYSLLTSLIFTGCGNPNNKTSDKAKQSAISKPSTIEVFVTSPEYSEAMKAYINEYKNVNPNLTINLKTIQSEYPKMLKLRIQSGNIPDVFASLAGNDIKAYSQYSADLTDEPMTKAMTDSIRANMSYNGRVYGFPIKANTFGLIYNKEIFLRYGISVPKTLTHLTYASERLKIAGIQPFTTGYKEWWVFKHVFMHFFDAAQPNDVDGLVNKFYENKAKFKDYPIINKNWFDFVDLTVKYGDPKPIQMDLATEIKTFSSGKAAMMIGQGPWVESEIVKQNPNIKIGFTGYPTTDDPADAFLVCGADQAIRINKNSPALQETLDLYNWLYTSDYGKNWFTNVAKVIPPIKDAHIPETQINQEMNEFISFNKAGDMYINYSSDSFHQQFGEIMQNYITKKYSREKAIKEIEKAWPELGAEEH